VKPQKEKVQTMKSILVSALVLGLLTSAAFTAEKPWTDEEQTSGVRKQEYVRYAFAGQQMRLRQIYALDIDCTPTEWAYEITKQPEHGTVEIITTSFYPTYPKDNPRFRCNEQKIEGHALIYTPAKGYKGPDSFVFQEINNSGFAWETTYTFNVRSAPATTTGPKRKDA
jgi:hypothetical protein